MLTSLNRKRGILPIIAIIAVLMLTSVSCNLVSNILGSVLDNADEEEIPAVQEDLPINDEYEEPQQEEAPTQAAVPTQVVQEEVEHSAALSGDTLYLVGKQAVIVDEYYSYGVFVAGNPRTDCMYDNAQYSYTAYDANNTEVYSEVGGYLETVLPGGQVAEIIYLPDEAKNADHLEIALDAGDCKAASVSANAISVSNPFVIEDEYYPTATAIITNNLDDFQTEIYVAALAYDAGGNIVGTGSTNVNVLFPSDYTGVEVYLNKTLDTQIASVEFFATHSYFSEIGLDTTFFETAYLADQLPWVQIENSYETVFYLINDDPNLAALDVEYQLTIVDENDHVLAVETGWIDQVLPGDVTPVYISADLPEGATAYTHWVELTPGEFGEPAFAANPFSAANYAVDEDGFWPVVTFDLTNNSDKAVTDLEMVVIVYDVDGNFIGGGSGTSEILSGNSTVGQEVTVNLAGTADAADVYLVIDYWTEIEGQEN